MINVGLTGGIGSGKTTVAKLFANLGVPIYFSDSQSKNLLDTDVTLKAHITKTFNLSLDIGGLINKKELASIVFSDKKELAKLNALVHPRVALDYKRWVDSHDESIPYVIKEAAILFESGAAKSMDKIIAVTAPEEIRIARVMKRDNISREDVLKRMENQWSEEKKVKLSNFIIDNSGDRSLIKQVLSVHQLLTSLKIQFEEE